MSIITTDLPSSLEICDVQCPIRTDVKTWLKFSQLISTEMTPKTVADMFALVFYELPPNFMAAFDALGKFYSHSDKTAQADKKKATEQKRVFDFDFDGDLIYAAFLQQYRIDLCMQPLHWWQFKALFNCLSEETQFVKVMQYRSMNLAEIKDKKQRSFYRKMKQAYRLPDNRSEAQKEADMNDALSAFM